MMGEELLLSPEITMHEEPGHITIHQDAVSIELDDEEEAAAIAAGAHFPFVNGDIPPEISITKVTGSSRAHFTNNRPMLKIRNDLIGYSPPSTSPNVGGVRPVQVRPPPLVRRGSALPPMPRLRFGGPRVQRPQSPLVGMINMQQQMFQRMPAPGGMQGFNRSPGMHMAYRRPPGPPTPSMANGNGQSPSFAGRGGRPTMSMFQHQQHHSMPSQRPSPTVINVSSSISPSRGGLVRPMSAGALGPRPGVVSPRPTVSPFGASISVSRSGGSLPPIMRGGVMRPSRPMSQRPEGNKPVQVRAVFVPPPMRMNTKPHVPAKPQSVLKFPQQHATKPPTGTGVNNGEDEEIDDEEETFLDEELDDVEPDVDPNTNEVDDVEPMEEDDKAARAQEDLIRKIDQHQVTVSITPKASSNNPVKVKEEEKPRSPGKVQYVRRADGKGFVRKIMGEDAMSFIRMKKKKKKKPFRGLNYRFDGSRIKKRGSRKPPSTSSVNGDAEDGIETPPRDPSFLEYLGIQRKYSIDSKNDTISIAGSGDSEVTIRAVGHKAKKSFKQDLTAPNNISSRNFSIHETSSTDSVSLLKRRLSLSEVLHSQKKMRADQQGVRNSFGGNQVMKNSNMLINGGAAAMSEFLQSEVKVVDEEEEELAIEHAQLAPLPRLRHRKAAPSDPDTPLQTCVCECDSEEQLSEAPRKPGIANFCQAIESVGGNKVGCKNKVEDFKLRRTTAVLERKLFCATHVQRLKGHHVCAFCGEFCAHGLFFMCRPTKKSHPHFFHKPCYLKREKEERKCPHCDSNEQPLVVQLKLNMTKVPLSLLQISSKMTFPKNKVKKSDLILKREDVITYKMGNGKIISSEGLPEGISNEALDKVLKALEDKQTLKHATRNMYIPVKAGDNVKMMQLLSLGYSPNARFSECENGTPLHVSASEGHVLTTHILVQAGAELDMLDDEQNTALMLACIKGHAEVVRYLLQAGADLTLRGDDGMTCLHLATQNGFLESAHVILNQTNLPRNFLNTQDEGGWTPLVWACENKHESVIRYLLERGADPLITDAEGNIALHWAALSGSKSTCELLINAGCDVNATNNIGETPMHISLRQDHYECAVLLLMRGARLDLRNKNKQTPAECMVTNDVKCRSIVRLSTTLHQMMLDAKTARSERIVCNDITRSKESNPIQCVNLVDDATEPMDYVYVSKNCVTSMVPIDRNISKLQHCNCTDTCSSEDSCHCSDLSVKSWYDLRGCLKDGFDYKEPPMIFECNEMCKCNVSICHNRVIQHGITARLQVFRTDGMGWGVRAITDIRKGSFVCEYVGEIISDSEADTREDSYLFDLDNRDGETFCIDANKYGNIARFINHSCMPNVVPVKVFAEHQDLRFPHIALFASRDISRGQELGFDYGEKFWVIKHKYFTCHCNSEKCRYSKSSIYGFLKEYYARIGEPLPDDAKPPTVTSVKVKEEVKTAVAPVVEEKPESDEVKQEEVKAKFSTEEKKEVKTKPAEEKKEAKTKPAEEKKEAKTRTAEEKKESRSKSVEAKKEPEKAEETTKEEEDEAEKRQKRPPGRPRRAKKPEEDAK